MDTRKSSDDGEIKVVNETLRKYADVILNGKLTENNKDVIVAVYSNYDEKTIEIMKGYSIENIAKYLNRPGYNVTAYTSSGSHKFRIIADGKLLYNETWIEY